MVMDILGNVRKGNQKSGGDNTMKSLADLMRLQLQIQKAQPDERDEKIKNLDMQLKQANLDRLNDKAEAYKSEKIKKLTDEHDKRQDAIRGEIKNLTNINIDSYDKLLKQNKDSEEMLATSFFASMDSQMKLQYANFLEQQGGLSKMKDIMTARTFAALVGIQNMPYAQEFEMEYQNLMKERAIISKSLKNSVPAIYVSTRALSEIIGNDGIDTIPRGLNETYPQYMIQA